MSTALTVVAVVFAVVAWVGAFTARYHRRKTDVALRRITALATPCNPPEDPRS